MGLKSQHHYCSKRCAIVKRWPRLVRDIVSMLPENCHFLRTRHGIRKILDGGLMCWVTMKRLECCLVTDRQQDGSVASYPNSLGCPWGLASVRLGLTGVTW